MLFFKLIVGFLGLIAIGTGIMDFWHGVAAQEALGAELGKGFRDATLNNIFRFFAAIWIGFGVFLILFTTDLARYYFALILAFLITVLGGMGRVMSIVEFGISEGREQATWAIVGLELILVPLLLVWLVWARRSGRLV
jgi:hypothetical protein